MPLTYSSVSQQQVNVMLDELKEQAEVKPVPSVPAPAQAWTVRKTIGFIPVAAATVVYDPNVQTLHVDVTHGPAGQIDAGIKKALGRE